MRSGEVTTAVVSGIDIILVLCVAVCDQGKGATCWASSTVTSRKGGL